MAFPTLRLRAAFAGGKHSIHWQPYARAMCASRLVALVMNNAYYFRFGFSFSCKSLSLWRTVDRNCPPQWALQRREIMEQILSGKRIAILITDGFRLEELTQPRKALEAAGARADVVSPNKSKVKGWKGDEWAGEFTV